jgi:hypothetical protein
MATRAYVAHQMHGRVRLRIPAARHRPAKLHRIAEQVRSVHGVKSAEVNPTSGSLLIKYSEAVLGGLGALLAALGAAGLPIELVGLASEEAGVVGLAGYSGVASAIGSLVQALDHQTKAATGNQFDLRVLLPLSAAGLGLAVMRETPAAPTPLWLTLIIFAFSSFVMLNRPHPEENTVGQVKQPEQAYLH